MSDPATLPYAQRVAASVEEVFDLLRQAQRRVTDPEAVTLITRALERLRELR